MTRERQPAAQVTEALDRYCAGTYDSQDFDAIYAYCLRIATMHVRFIDRYTPGGCRLFGDQSTVESEAASFLGKMFISQKEGEKTILARIWCSLVGEQGLPHAEAQVHLTNVIRSIVAQQRIENYRANRPQEWRIRRSLRLNVQRSTALQLVRGNGDLLIAPRNGHTHGWVAFPDDILRNHCYSVFTGSDDLEEMVRKLEELFVPGSLYNCVRFSSFAEFAIAYIGDMYAAFDSSVSVTHSMRDGELERLVRGIMDRLRGKLETTYFDSGKIPGEMIPLYLSALEMFLRDLLHTGKTDTQFSYLSSELPEIDKEQFSAEHKTRFGYMVAEMKDLLESAANEYITPSRNNPLHSYSPKRRGQFSS